MYFERFEIVTLFFTGEFSAQLMEVEVEKEQEGIRAEPLQYARIYAHSQILYPFSCEVVSSRS